MMKYKLIQRASTLDKTKKKWYASGIKAGNVSQRELAKRIALNSSLSIGDVINVIENLLEEIPNAILDGKTLKLGEVGNFRITLMSEGAETKSKFTTQNIKPRIVFRPGKLLKQSLENIKYERSE